jgi:glutathione peroxidase
MVLHLLFNWYAVLATSIYSLSVNTISGETIKLSEFKGRKILIVNTASKGRFYQQYGELEQLHQKYKDNLVIIAFPSNDFGNEPETEKMIAENLRKSFNIHYILGNKVSVKGDRISPLYGWLSWSWQNGVMDNTITQDFCKFLIDTDGNLIGVFNGGVSPLSNQIESAIAN